VDIFGVFKMKQRGFSLLELLGVMVIVGILTVIAIPMFGGPGIECPNQKGEQARISYTERARVAAAMGQLGEINLAAQRFDLNHRRAPTSLGELGIADTTDPWGNEYVFLSFEGVNGHGPKRKAWSNVPVNNYFDVYSMGPDGKTSTPFTSTPGADDIVIAGDGQYVGIACEYYVK
jgi:general secretion pathway protein G